ncbi:60S ribosomal subunit assembly/export protein [Friedmanniomyces endolithicus]|nr:60S ribosomal subunit assembly/export protein [Friedmanniomyces endolithicus]
MAPAPKGSKGSKGGPSKPSNKRPSSSKTSKTGSSFKARKPSSKPAAKPTQQKTKSSAQLLKKRKPPHLRYTEKELKVPQLNGINPTGVQKRPNAKKGKKFVDDKDQMNAILALVMAEKEGNIESKMMRARQLEEVREARKLEAEKRVEGKKAGMEERKQGLKDKKRKGRHSETGGVPEEAEPQALSKRPRKSAPDFMA